MRSKVKRWEESSGRMTDGLGDSEKSYLCLEALGSITFHLSAPDAQGPRRSEWAGWFSYSYQVPRKDSSSVSGDAGEDCACL